MAGPGPGGRVRKKPKVKRNTIREGEFATAQNAPEMSERVRRARNRRLRGERDPSSTVRESEKKAPLTARAQFNLMKKLDPKGTTRFSEFVRSGGKLTAAQLKQARAQSRRRDPSSTVRESERVRKLRKIKPAQRGPRFE